MTYLTRPQDSLFLEPWGFLPSQVADLTFDQIEGLYRRPAAERAKLLDRGRKPEPGGDNRPTRELPTKEAFVASMLAECGGDPAKWVADYDRLAEEWDADPGE